MSICGLPRGIARLGLFIVLSGVLGISLSPQAARGAESEPAPHKAYTLPDFILPWDGNLLNGHVFFTGGPHDYGKGGQFGALYTYGSGSGLDFAGDPDHKDFPVLAMATGQLVGADCNGTVLPGLGCVISIRHDVGGSVLTYAHLDSSSSEFLYWQHRLESEDVVWVRQGDLLARAGCTGAGAKGPNGTCVKHLHLELRDQTPNGPPIGWEVLAINGGRINGYWIYGFAQGNNYRTGGQFYNYDGVAVNGNWKFVSGFHFVDATGLKTDVTTGVGLNWTCPTSGSACSAGNWENNNRNDPTTQFALTGNGGDLALDLPSGDGIQAVATTEQGLLYSSNHTNVRTPGDTRPPSGSLTAPASDSHINSRTVTLTASASDNAGGTGVREVRFSAKWNDQWHGIGVAFASPYTISWDWCASNVPNGTVELGLEVWDQAGNQFVWSEDNPGHLANPKIVNEVPSCDVFSPSDWTIQYWTNTFLAGAASASNGDHTQYLYKEWGGNPPIAGIGATSWSARFVTTRYFEGGQYHFHGDADNDVRLMVDGTGTDWSGNANLDRFLPQGNHVITVEYRQNEGGSKLQVWWRGPGAMPTTSQVSDHWFAQYYPNVDLWGGAPLELDEGDGFLNKDWGSAGPGWGLPSDNFGTRFRRTVQLACGTYQLDVFSDDGVRVRLDNTLIPELNQWHGLTGDGRYSALLPITAGAHEFNVEHYDSGGSAGVQLHWTLVTPCLPDLAPMAPAGYAAPVVPASRQGTHTSDSLFADASTFMDWYFGNISGGPANAAFVVDLWVDNQRVVRYPFDGIGLGASQGFDDWADSIPTAGWHTVRLVVDPDNTVAESNENNNTWEGQFLWQSFNGWKGEYFSNPTLTGQPWVVRDDATLNFDWFGEPPDPSLPSDNFSARWTRVINVQDGLYRFHLSHDDGAQLIVDGIPRIDAWDSCCQWRYVDVPLTAGNHTIQVTMFDSGGWANANIWLEQLNIANWRGEYFSNPSLSGNPVFVRDDFGLDFDWADRSPGPLVPADGFSVRWSRSIPLPAGNYRFSLRHDDGARLIVDGATIIDEWNTCCTPHSGLAILGDGSHNIVVELRDDGGFANVGLYWEPTSTTGWSGLYCNQPDLSGCVFRQDDGLDEFFHFDWGDGSPSPLIRADGFSARWSKYVDFPLRIGGSLDWRFTIAHSDGARVTIRDREGDHVILDNWCDNCAVTDVVTHTMVFGRFPVTIELKDISGPAFLSFSWENIRLPTLTPDGTSTVDVATATNTPTATPSPTPTGTRTPTQWSTATSTVAPPPTAEATPTVGLTGAPGSTATANPSEVITPLPSQDNRVYLPHIIRLDGGISTESGKP